MLVCLTGVSKLMTSWEVNLLYRILLSLILCYNLAALLITKVLTIRIWFYSRFGISITKIILPIILFNVLFQEIRILFHEIKNMEISEQCGNNVDLGNSLTLHKPKFVLLKKVFK